ncbi:hypothetical protein [Vagococcus hydrophili]|uniref:Uncharacterized protein n=1 Tax=Vagococcus hydrophili TaxID=2714947 RepID=A0A6G8ARY9_9ENTE|nr:hypothetical protein [Vagococcus hydrophili]QIL47766.1 hypothetical protein G7082_04025 [Vagococcus hydrophili]
MAYFKFQLKGILKNKFNYVPVILGLVLILVCLFSNASNYDKTGLRANLMTSIKENKEMSIKQTEELKKDSNTEGEINNLRNDLESTKKRLKQEEDVISYMNSENWQSTYERLLKINAEDKEMFESSKEDYHDVEQAIKKEKMYYQYLKIQDMPYQDPDFPTKGFTFMMWCLSHVLPLIVVISVIYILTHVYSKKFYEQINKSSLFPYSKMKNISQNLLLGIVVGSSLFFIFLFFSLVVSGLIFGFGSSDFPILMYNFSKEEFYYQGLQTLYLPSVTLFLLALVFCILLVYWLNYVLRNQLTALFISLILIVSPMLLIYVIQPMSKIAHLLPTTYLSSLRSTSGMLSSSLNNAQVNLGMGLQIMVISCILMLGLIVGTQFKIKKY